MTNLTINTTDATLPMRTSPRNCHGMASKHRTTGLPDGTWFGSFDEHLYFFSMVASLRVTADD